MEVSHLEEEGEEHSVVIFRVLTLGCDIRSLSFCPPHFTLDLCSSCLYFLSQLPPASPPDPPLLCPGPAEGHCG